MKARLLAVLIALAMAHTAIAARAKTQSAVASRAAGKGVLVLQVGSDWCVSGESVRKAFESREFRRAVESKFALAVYDDMESPTPAAKAANDAIGSLLIRTKRFPAITCYASEGGRLRVFAQIENVPQGVDAEKLQRAVAKVVARKDQAARLFSKAKSSALSEEAAADLYGEAFDILASMMGPFHFKELTEGEWAWRAEWKALSALDAGDRFGWTRHFAMDDKTTVDMVNSVTLARNEDSTGEKARAIVAAMKKVPEKHLSANQRQCVKVMEYALTYGGMDAPLSEGERKLMEDAFALGRDTLWGQFAMGRLIIDGKDIASRGLPAAKVRPRAEGGAGQSAPPFPLEAVKRSLAAIRPNAELTEEQKLAIARYAVLRLVGEEAWGKVASRAGARPFVKAFFSDRAWLEDFAWSGSFPKNSRDGDCPSEYGPGAAAGAFLALETLVFQDGGRWVPALDGRFADNEGRRFMTALAINYPDRSEEYLADVLDAYRATAKAGRLHKSAYSQPVWLWRFAVQQGLRSNYLDGNTAAQQRQLDRFLNMPTRNGGGDTTGLMDYNLYNCFGEKCNTSPYYQPWRKAGEWPMSRYVQAVGGVCAQISTYGSAVANAHGMPSTTVDEPGHLSYTRRLLDGTWRLDYTVTGHSKLRMAFWNRRQWQYSAALERTFTGDREKRLSADRLLELAHLAEERGDAPDAVEACFRRACNLWPHHYRAWFEYGEWVARSGATAETMRTWLKGCARGMKTGGRPLWDFLTPYFARVAEERGGKGLAEELVNFAPLLKQSELKLQQEADFAVALDEWCKPLAGDAARMRAVLKAMLAAQFGTRDYFSQTMVWGSEYFLAHGSADDFLGALGEAMASSTKGAKAAIDFGPMILAASESGNVSVFQQLVGLKKKLSKDLPRGPKYASLSFGGSLIGAEGLLKTSSRDAHADPSRYGLVIDDSPCGDIGIFTHKEKAPWAEVVLAGPSIVRAVVVENRTKGFPREWQVPLYVDVSEDGENWTRVKTVDKAADTFRIDLKGDARRAQYVRVGRVEGAKDEFFHLAKLLVYGTKLY